MDTRPSENMLIKFLNAWGANEMDQDTAPPNSSNELMIWRLGKVEKLVETNHTDIVTRLDRLGELSQEVKEHGWRLNSLEKSRERILMVLVTLATGTIMIAIQQIFNIF